MVLFKDMHAIFRLIFKNWNRNQFFSGSLCHFFPEPWLLDSFPRKHPAPRNLKIIAWKMYPENTLCPQNLKIIAWNIFQETPLCYVPLLPIRFGIFYDFTAEFGIGISGYYISIEIALAKDCLADTVTFQLLII